MSRLRQRSHLGNRVALVSLLAIPIGLTIFFTFRTTNHAAEDQKPAEKLEIKKGDHICIIGNTLADRLQHDGWLETYFHSRFPKDELVFRNLGFSGDEVNHRMRSMDFGTPDQWLSGSAPIPQPQKIADPSVVRKNRFELINTNADVVFAFFGYNESYAGEKGLDKFKKELDDFVKHTLAQKYNGKSAPRLVLFSPIAHENLHDPNLPDGKENNQRLELYTAAMADVAKTNKIPFVDLFHPTRTQYGRAGKPLTINGVHLNEQGNNVVAQIIDKALFGADPAPNRDPKELERLRQAVLDKNFHWFNRYRVLDGYNMYGGRAFEKYAGGQTNYEAVQREMEILDVMTSNRDKRIWAVAQGGDLKIDDSNAPDFVPVKTNFPGKGPGGAHIFLDGEEEIKHLKIAKGLKVNLFASEKEFPELAKPVQMSWDAQGRLWVAVWPSYPHWKPKDEMNDKILIFEDTKGTGNADKMTVFADHLNCPTGFEFYNGGILIAQAPDILFLKDTKGTGKADLRQRVLSGIDSADSHHTSNSFALDPGGALYFQEGTFHRTQVETPWGPTVRCADAGVFRYEPRSHKFDVYVSYPFANPHGHVWDRWGADFVYDGTGANPFHGALFSGHLEFPQKHPHPPQVYAQRMRPCPGVEILSSRHFPEEFQGNLLVANVIGDQGILRYKVEEKGASFTAKELEPILLSDDRNFRPSDLKVGPDGALYFIDWHNPIIGHLQHAIRDPNRDRTHGRIYRVTYEGRSLLEPVKIAGEPIDKLLDALKSPEDRVRYRARIELGSRDTDKVIAGVKQWIDTLDKKDADYEHDLLEALWVFQYQNVVSVDLLKRELSSPDFHSRAAATRVLCYWRDRVPDSLELLKKLAADENPRVRLEAVRAASFFTVPEAIEVALVSLERPTDPYLDFTRAETIRALDPYVKKAIADGKDIPFTTPAGARYFLKNVGTDDLLKMKRTQGVYLELLFRKGVRDEFRKEALTGLAGIEKKSEARVLIDAINKHDEQPGAQDETVIYDLVRLLTGRSAAELTAARADLEKLATSGNASVSRQLGYVALIAADGNVEKAWAVALKSVRALQDLVNAMPLIRDPGHRAALYPKVEPLLKGLPKELDNGSKDKGVFGRFVRISLPGNQRTLTLAEVEVMSDGHNMARRGKASQKNTAHGGDAARAIDGNKSGNYGDGGQTHTEENTADPWWEVDLGAEQPIESIIIYNRTDSDLGKRLDNFTLQVFDKDRGVVFEKNNQPAPDVKVAFTMDGEAPQRIIRRAAMNALTSVRGKEADAFKALAPFLRDDKDRGPALQAILRIPVTFWPQESAKPTLDDVLALIRKIPAKDRTTPEALDAMQLADSLASLLPLDEAKKIRKELGELGVRIIRLATVPEQMLFNKERLVVRAGKPCEILFENNDLMPHNFVLTQPGALQAVGLLAEETGTQRGAAERQYVPASDKILVSSKLLQPREAQKISFTAPAKTGVYPYVCTYPGHWRRMFGALYVVDDLEAYLADEEGYLTKHPLPAQDELLKNNRPRKEWKLDELAPIVEKLESGRSFANGKQMFQVGTCISCHKFGGVGTEFGPDLSKIDPKQQKPVEILHDILEPSFRINEKYQTYKFELKSGKNVSGIILEETPKMVKIIENPLTKAEPIILKVDDIESRAKSPVSMMPKGLLDKMTTEEILDLIAYVYSRADPQHAVFKGGGHDHGHEH
jgi:putative heme-binding domain-containing protein